MTRAATTSKAEADEQDSEDVPLAPHPAKFSEGIVEAMAVLLVDHHGCVLDPFAGTGRIHALSEMGDWCTHGIEIEPEWAAYDDRTLHGDSRDMPFDDGSFIAVACSPTYANGMGQKRPYRNNSGGIRHSYADRLGRELTEGNTGAVRWGEPYRELHRAVWAETARVSVSGARLLMNFKDPLRKGRLLPVTGWHTEVLAEFGFVFQGVVAVATHGMRAGEHANHRVGQGEVIMVYDKK